jgi:mono/diheme cytochrome c family protein
MRWSVCLLATSAIVLAIVAVRANPAAGRGDNTQIERGKYLVQLGGCNDCHTPGYLLGKPDLSSYLGGSDVGLEVQGAGTFVGRNLTPDKETGKQIVIAIQTGVRPDGRLLAPVMPWRAYSRLTKSDAGAIADYLRSLPPVRHEVPGPFGPSQKPTVVRMTLVPPDANYQSK